MNYCSECGARVERVRIEADNKYRFYCAACDTIHYQNPKVLVSLYATWEDKILWIRRNTQPHKGLWSAPSGYVEEDENLVVAAVRELEEETRAQVDVERVELHMVGNLVHMNQIYVVFRAPLLKPEFETTEEASEVRLFAKEDFPFDEFAYPEVAANVQLIYDDLCSGKFAVYTGVLEDGRNTVRTVSEGE